MVHGTVITDETPTNREEVAIQHSLIVLRDCFAGSEVGWEEIGRLVVYAVHSRAVRAIND